jgi:hypothetical protein
MNKLRMQTTRGSDDENGKNRAHNNATPDDGELVPFKFNQIKSHIRAKILSFSSLIIIPITISSNLAVFQK